MSFPAQVFRVLIASPSDVSEERELAVRAIQEWNDLNASERRLVLLPLRWETHSSPEYGSRPQDTINRQVVDHCDLLIGIFWTRIGSPTGIAESGTIEEIERVANSGKPVMLYFSRASQDPDNLDLEQLARLREFKKLTFPKALVESYSGLVEFKEKLSKQIELQLRTILAEEATEEVAKGEDVRPITDIIVHYAHNESGLDLGPSLDLKTAYFDLEKFDELPDFELQTEKVEPNPLHTGWFASLREGETNKNYYRQHVTSVVLKEFFQPIRFSLKNRGGVGARDVYIELLINSTPDSVVFILSNRIPSGRPSTTSSGHGLMADIHPTHPEEIIELESTTWSTHLEVQALQPQRELSPETIYYIGAKSSCDVTITAKIFADTLPIPVIQKLKLRINVEKFDVTAKEVLEAITMPVENPTVASSSVTKNEKEKSAVANKEVRKESRSNKNRTKLDN